MLNKVLAEKPPYTLRIFILDVTDRASVAGPLDQPELFLSTERFIDRDRMGWLYQLVGGAVHHKHRARYLSCQGKRVDHFNVEFASVISDANGCPEQWAQHAGGQMGCAAGKLSRYPLERCERTINPDRADPGVGSRHLKRYCGAH